MCKVSYITFNRSVSKPLDDSGDWSIIQWFSIYISWDADGVAVRGSFDNSCKSLLIWADGYDSAKILTRTGAEETRFQYFQNLEYVENNGNVALFLASAVSGKIFADVRILIAENLETLKTLGPRSCNFCCLYNFNTARHWEIIYLKDLWPNLASNAVCQCLQMYCFLLHSLVLSMGLWEHQLTTSKNMSAISCELSSFPC